MNKKPFLMFEVFPPKTSAGLEPLYNEIDKLVELNPRFISVTQGANGSNAGEQLEVLRYMAEAGQKTVANLTCIDKQRGDIDRFVKNYYNFAKTGSQVLALRGDIPAGRTGTGGAFDHADELIEYLRSKWNMPTIASCYPEVHLEARGWWPDMLVAYRKEAKGAIALISQLCYDYDTVQSFFGRLRDNDGFRAKLICGVMPVTKPDRCVKMALKNGCSIPADLARIIGRYGDKPEEFRKAGKEFTMSFLDKLSQNHVADGVQIFTLNEADDAIDIVKGAGLV